MSHPDQTHLTAKTAILVFVALLILLAAAVSVPFLPLGPWRPVAAMTIAFAKMLLIILFFMQVRYRGGTLIAFVVGGYVWLAVLFMLTLADYFTRAGS